MTVEAPGAEETGTREIEPTLFRTDARTDEFPLLATYVPEPPDSVTLATALHVVNDAVVGETVNWVGGGQEPRASPDKWTMTGTDDFPSENCTVTVEVPGALELLPRRIEPMLPLTAARMEPFPLAAI